MLYGNINWYDGEWFEDKYHGLGVRQYTKNARYKGHWANGYQNGLGTMVYENGDVSFTLVVPDFKRIGLNLSF